MDAVTIPAAGYGSSFSYSPATETTVFSATAAEITAVTTTAAITTVAVNGLSGYCSSLASAATETVSSANPAGTEIGSEKGLFFLPRIPEYPRQSFHKMR